MNEFLSTEILQKMMKQKQSLIALNPKPYQGKCSYIIFLLTFFLHHPD